MPRRVITNKDKAEVDDYLTILLKYIPAEIVAAFIVIDSSLKAATEVSKIVYWIVFAILLVATPFFVWRATHDPGEKEAKTQIVVSSIAFVVWVFALGGPFNNLQWYMPVYGAILLVIYTTLIPAFVLKIEKRRQE